MGTQPKLHLRLIEGLDHLQSQFESVIAPESDGGIQITPMEILELSGTFHDEIVPLVTTAADTMRLVGTAIDVGVESAWLARKMNEQIEDLKVVNLDRFRAAKDAARLIVLEDYRGEGFGGTAA